MTRVVFDPAFLQRQAAVYPGLDVHVVAANVREYASRHHVENPEGLLVHWLSKQERQRRAAAEARERATTADAERYARFWVELLRLASTRGLGPEQLAACVETARGRGFSKLNAHLERYLRLAAATGTWADEHARR